MREINLLKEKRGWYFVLFSNLSLKENIGACSIYVNGGLEDAVIKVRELRIAPENSVVLPFREEEQDQKLKPNRFYSKQEMLDLGYMVI